MASSRLLIVWTTCLCLAVVAAAAPAGVVAKRNFVRYDDQRWPDGKFYYRFVKNNDGKMMSEEMRNKVRSTFKFFTQLTCIKPMEVAKGTKRHLFTAYRSKTAKELRQDPDSSSCNAVGYAAPLFYTKSGRLAKFEVFAKKECKFLPSFSWGGILHETLHTLGFGHEQKRQDRHKHVKYNEKNVDKDHRAQYKVDDKQTMQTGRWPYDFDSIMHYADTAFARKGSDGKPLKTLVRENGKDIDANRLFPSAFDVLDINDVYCNGDLPPHWQTRYRRLFKERSEAAGDKIPCDDTDHKCFCRRSELYRDLFGKCDRDGDDVKFTSQKERPRFHKFKSKSQGGKNNRKKAGRKG